MIIDTVPSTIEFEAIDGGYDADRENEPSNDMAIGESEGHMCPATPSILQSRNFRLSPPCAPLRFKLPLDLSASSFPPLPFAVDELEPSSQCGGRHSRENAPYVRKSARRYVPTTLVPLPFEDDSGSVSSFVSCESTSTGTSDTAPKTPESAPKSSTNLKNLQVDSKRCSPRMDKVKARVLISRAA